MPDCLCLFLCIRFQVSNRAFPGYCLTTGGSSVVSGSTVPVFAACNATDPNQAFQTYPATIATPSIGPTSVTVQDPGITGKMVGAFKLAANAAGGVNGQLTSYQSFVSTVSGVSVNVNIGFLSTSFAAASLPMETMLTIATAVYSAQSSANDGAIPTYLTINADNYLYTVRMDCFASSQMSCPHRTMSSLSWSY